MVRRSRLGRVARYRLLHEVEMGRRVPEVVIGKNDLEAIKKAMKGKGVSGVIYGLERIKHG